MTAATIVTAPGLSPAVQIALADSRIPIGGASWDLASWDDGGVWGGGHADVEPTWVDVSCYVHNVETNVGRDRSIDRWQVGNASVTLNNTSGLFDLRPPSDDPTVFEVRPGRPLRVGASLDGGPPRWLFRGFIDGLTPAYDPELHDTVTVQAVDVKGEVGKAQVAAVDEPGVGAGETAPERIGRVLDAVRWPAAARALDPSADQLRPTTLGAQAVDLIDVAADSVGGVVYGDTEGRVVFRAGAWQIWNPADPPDATIGNEQVPSPVLEAAEPVTFFAEDVTFGTVYGDGVCPTGWEMSFDLADIATRVIVGRSGDEPVVLDDAPNQARYGVETFTRTDLECVDPAVAAREGARLLRTLSADFMPNIAAVSLDAGTSTAARDLCVTVDPMLPSRYRCVLVAAGGRIVFDRQFLAVGVQHRVAPESWATRIALDDAAPYAFDGEVWDAAEWDVDEWAADPFEPVAEPLPIGASL